jgi:hypothetical protein
VLQQIRKECPQLNRI